MPSVVLFSDFSGDGLEPVATISLPDLPSPPTVITREGRAFALRADARYVEVTCFHAAALPEALADLDPNRN